MHRPKRRSAIASVSVLAVVLSLAFAGAAAEGAPGRLATATKAPVKFVQRTPTLRSLAKANAAATSSLSGDFGDKAELPYLDAKEPREQEFGVEGDGAGDHLPGDVPVTVVNATHAHNGWQGLNHFDSRYSDNGNQFSGEPPDQGLCAGNGFVFEIVNSVVQVYTTDGTALLPGDPFFPGTEPVGLSENQFFGVESAFIRPAGPFGPNLFDITCLYDAPTGRWFVISDELDLDPATAALTGGTHIYFAVSTSSDPTGSWNIYIIDTQNNGQNGTPDHGCSGGFCFGDYPQTGLDANGLYITTNEFDLLGNGEFHAAQLYAFSKADLVAGSATPGNQYLQNVTSALINDVAYTMQPANSLPSDYDGREGGTMYFGMSYSPYVLSANQLVLWSLSNTASLDSGTPDLQLREAVVPTEAYSAPNKAQQKKGPTPLLKCINNFDCFGDTFPHQKSPLPLDGGSGKFYGSWLHDGVVYLTTATAMRGTGGAFFDDENGQWKPIREHIGVAYFGVAADVSSSGLGASLTQQGYVVVKKQNLIYPSIAVGEDGSGAIGVTLSGPGFYPSAAYAPFEVGSDPTTLQVVRFGKGPNDGFSGTGEGGFRPRWGDYGTATIDPDTGSIWLASEYIAQRCGINEWLADSTCGFTRTLFANWSTRITEIA
jgi:hypothetical protein